MAAQVSGAEIFAGALQHLLSPLALDVVTDERSLGEIDPSVPAIAQLVLVDLTPTPMQGQLLVAWELWLVVGTKDPGDAQTQLLQLLPQVTELLDSVTWLDWSKATRATHPNDFHALRLDLSTLAT